MDKMYLLYDTLLLVTDYNSKQKGFKYIYIEKLQEYNKN